MNIDTICYKKVNKDSSGNYNINCVASSGTVDQIVLNNSTLWCPSHTLSYGTSSCCCNTANKTFTVNYYNCDCVDREVSWSFCDYSGCCECKWKYHTVCYTSSTESSKPGWTCYCNKAYSCAVPCVGTASGSLNTCNYGSSVYSNDSCIPTGITLSNYNSNFSIGHSTRTYTCYLYTDVSSCLDSTGRGLTYTIKFNCNCLTKFGGFCCTYNVIRYWECRENFPWGDTTDFYICINDDNFIYDCYSGLCDTELNFAPLNFYPCLNCLTVCSYCVNFNFDPWADGIVETYTTYNWRPGDDDDDFGGWEEGMWEDAGYATISILACNRDQCFYGHLCVYCVSFDEYTECSCTYGECGAYTCTWWEFLGTRCCSITANNILYYSCCAYCTQQSQFSINAQNCPECRYRNAKVYYCVLPKCGNIVQYTCIDTIYDRQRIHFFIQVNPYSPGYIYPEEALNYAKRYYYNYTIKGVCYVWVEHYDCYCIYISPGKQCCVSYYCEYKRTLSDCLIGGPIIDCPSRSYDFTQEVCPYIGTNNEIILKVVDTGPGTTLPNCTLTYSYNCDGTCTCNYTCYYYCCYCYYTTPNKDDIATNNGTLDETYCTCCKRQVSGSVTVNANGTCTITTSYVDTIDNISTTGTIAVSRPIKNINVEYFT